MPTTHKTILAQAGHATSTCSDQGSQNSRQSGAELEYRASPNAAPAERKSKRAADHHDSPPTQKAKRARKTPKTSKDIEDEPQDAHVKPEAKPQAKPRLTTPDLEFDYDRSQLRDPRPTPGRVSRPRRLQRDLTEEWKQQFEIPKPVKPKGRLSSLQKDKLFEEATLLDPSAIFHDLYVCHRKGPHGSPTYDAAGFALDWHKVDNWRKPKPYNKRAVVRGMERAVTRAMGEQEQMYKIFFTNGEAPKEAENYMKDQVSKDLGIPWHQIGVPELRLWEEKGFQKQNAEEWWHTPTEEELKRMLGMLSGASLRKDL